jgi:hypothetical protein
MKATPLQTAHVKSGTDVDKESKDDQASKANGVKK